MKNSIMIKRLVGISILTALVVVLQLLGNYITIGTVNITLALIPIAVGAILYGPVAGLFLGMVMGAIILTAPSTMAFFSVNPVVTVLLCLLKSGLAGFLAGWLYRAIAYFANKCQTTKNKRIVNVVAAVGATIMVPVVNTLIFIIGAALFFYSVWELTSTDGAFYVIFLGVFGPNFAIEFTINVVLAPAVLTIIKIVTRSHNLGFANDFSNLNEEIA